MALKESLELRKNNSNDSVIAHCFRNEDFCRFIFVPFEQEELCDYFEFIFCYKRDYYFKAQLKDFIEISF